jgi:hypothetical protein
MSEKLKFPGIRDIFCASFAVGVSFASLAKAEVSEEGVYRSTQGWTIEIDANDLFYTGSWGQVPVRRKHFPFIIKSEDSFEMGNWTCKMKRVSFACLRERDQKVFDFVLIKSKLEKSQRLVEGAYLGNNNCVIEISKERLFL